MKRVIPSSFYYCHFKDDLRLRSHCEKFNIDILAKKMFVMLWTQNEPRSLIVSELKDRAFCSVLLQIVICCKGVSNCEEDNFVLFLFIDSGRDNDKKRGDYQDGRGWG